MLIRGFAAWIDGAEAKCKTGYGSPNSLEEATKMLEDCKAWREGTASVCASLETGKANADKMTLHEEQDKLYTEMKARRDAEDEAKRAVESSDEEESDTSDDESDSDSESGSDSDI